MFIENPDWYPFIVSEKTYSIRSIKTFEGIGDRLRWVAFAEKQASLGFRFAYSTFKVESSMISAWKRLEVEEKKHMNWLLERMKELKIEVSARPVNDRLWQSFLKCKNAREFSIFMMNSEEKGEISGEKFSEVLMDRDPKTAMIFKQIALEEKEHISIARSFLS